jgi:hypothetical protein
MKRFTLIAATVVAAILAVTNSASARLGIAPLAVQNDGAIQVRGHGHGHGHWRGHRSRGHHYGWYRGRGNWRHHHRRW